MRTSNSNVHALGLLLLLESKMLFRYSLLGGNFCGEVALGKTDVLTILCRIDDARDLQYYTKKE